MIQRKNHIFWLVAILGLSLILYTLSSVLMPFVAGIILAYLLDPVVDRLEKLGLWRSLSTFLVLTAFMLCSAGCFLLLFPVIADQLSNLTIFLPNIMNKLQPLFEFVSGFLNNNMQSESEDLFPSSVGNILEWGGGFLTKLISSSLAVANFLSLIIITPIVAFYLLRDWDLIVDKTYEWLPLEYKEAITEQILKIDKSLAALVRGQGCVCIVLALFYSVSLTAVGLQFGVLIGLFSGIISFIPFVGAILGAVFSVGLSIFQFDSYTPILLVTVIFFVGQILEGNFLTPKLIGDAVGLHPVWIIFALLTGGSIFGFLGILLALPIAVVVAVCTRFVMTRYLQSTIYHGNIAPSNPDSSQGVNKIMIENDSEKL